MRKENLRKFTMFVLVGLVSLGTAVISASAQSRNSVRADIPFEFVVGDKTLAAGEYDVSPTTLMGQALMIRNTENGSTAIRLSESTKRLKSRTHVRLVFHRYGPSYFLAEVWNGDSAGRQVIKSRQERGLQRELASIPSKSDASHGLFETVEVVAVLR